MKDYMYWKPDLTKVKRSLGSLVGMGSAPGYGMLGRYGKRASPWAWQTSTSEVLAERRTG